MGKKEAVRTRGEAGGPMRKRVAVIRMRKLFAVMPIGHASCWWSIHSAIHKWKKSPFS
jgi:hypothetical protein